MVKLHNEDIIYSLIIEDIQNVAQQELERSLSDNEIESIIDIVASNINWYDAIANAIHQSNL
jgi:hypothetical protein